MQTVCDIRRDEDRTNPYAARRDAFALTTTSGPGLTVVRMAGDVDLAGVPTLEARLGRVSASRPPLAVIDLSAVGYLSVRALSVLVAFRQSLIGHGGRTVLVGLRDPVRALFTHTGLDGVFDLRGT